MTPKEKAIELVYKFKDYADENYRDCTNEHELNEAITENAKQCAIIAVDLLISETFLDFYVNHPQPFWLEVKTELEKL
jgi:hypothetical protein